MCVAVTDFFGGTWNREGTILFGSPQGLFRVPAQGGDTPELITTLDASESGHYWPHFLPDGQHYLYTAWGPAERARDLCGDARIEGQDAASWPPSRMRRMSGADGHGYLLFHRDKAVYAQPFDAKTLALSGEPARVADEVTFDAGNGRGHFSVVADGALAYFQNTRRARRGGGPQSDLGGVAPGVGRAAPARSIETPGRPASIAAWKLGRTPSASPCIAREGRRRHLDRRADGRGDATDVGRVAAQRESHLVAGRASRSSSARSGTASRVFIRSSSDGSGTDELLFESDLPKAPMSWSPDGKFIVFGVQDPKTGADLWLLTLADKKAAPFIATPYTETHAQISPDGKWIAYTSNSVGGRTGDPRAGVPVGRGPLAAVRRRRRLAALAQGRQGTLLPFARQQCQAPPSPLPRLIRP